VTPGIDLNSLSHAEKDELILSLLPLVGRLEAALARIAELERRLARFERPAKTPDNSSLPPSKGQKPERGAGDKPEPGSCGRCQAERLPELPGGISGGDTDPAAGLRTHRTASHQAGCDAGAPVRRSLRLLR
jgi:hypothetical protein